jgi:glutamate carboxypeptidase
MLDYFKAQEAHIVDMLIGLVEHESFTTAKYQVDQLADHLTTLLEPLNPSSITRIPQESVGDFLLARWNEDAPGKPIMVMMHMDTVHPVGSLETMPVRSDDEGRLYGPGVADMKGGIAVAIAALQGLIERDELPNRPIWYLFTSDEET